MNDKIGDLLRFDPLDAAEKLTGKDYHDDQGTSALGFLMHMDHSERKARALKATDDTYYGIPFVDALRVFESEGFVIVYDVPFTAEREHEDNPRVERHVIMWNPLGVLIDVHSYQGTTVNSGKMHYAVRFNEGIETWGLTSSGMGVDDPMFPGDKDRFVWVGDHDIREGFRHNFRALAGAGTFVTPWPERPWLSLTHYANFDSDTYKAETDRVLSLLPAEVQACVGKRVSA